MVASHSEHGRPDLGQPHHDENPAIFSHQADCDASSGDGLPDGLVDIGVVQPRDSETAISYLSAAPEPDQADGIQGWVPQNSADIEDLPLMDFTCQGSFDSTKNAASDDVQASGEETLIVPESKPTIASPRRDRPRKTTRKLEKAYNRMSGLRDHVLSEREGLRMEYEDLSWRLDDVRQSHEELMNLLRHHFANGTNDHGLQYIDDVWQQVNRDSETFGARLERIRQLSDRMIEPEAHLIIADEDFLAAAKKATTYVNRVSSAQDDSRRPETKQEHADVDIQEQTNLLERLRTARMNIKMFKERLNELHREQSEDLEERDFLLDRNDLPCISDEEFYRSFFDARTAIEKDLQKAHADVRELEAACLRGGLDAREEVLELDSAVTSEVAEEEPFELEEQSSQSFEPGGFTGHSTPRIGDTSAQAWSSLSEAGSHHTKSSEEDRIYNWMDHQESSAQKVYDFDRIGIQPAGDMSRRHSFAINHNDPRSWSPGHDYSNSRRTKRPSSSDGVLELRDVHAYWEGNTAFTSSRPPSPGFGGTTKFAC